MYCLKFTNKAVISSFNLWFVIPLLITITTIIWLFAIRIQKCCFLIFWSINNKRIWRKVRANFIWFSLNGNFWEVKTEKTGTKNSLWPMLFPCKVDVVETLCVHNIKRGEGRQPSFRVSFFIFFNYQLTNLFWFSSNYSLSLFSE